MSAPLTGAPAATREGRGVARLQSAFQQAEAEGRAAFIPYMTAGFPDRSRFLEVAATLLERADILEVGIPYSDPLGDGPTIQRASEDALAAGTSTRGTLDLVRELRRTHDTPISVMTYVNPIYAVGPETFMRLAAEAGVDGLILPDLPPDQDIELIDLATRYGLGLTFLIAPTSTPERVKLVAEACTAFLYAVSVVGVTGAREEAALGEVPEMLALAREHTRVPVVVGFGVRDARAAQALAPLVDGVVVGSTFINAIRQGADLRALVHDIADGCRR